MAIGALIAGVLPSIIKPLIARIPDPVEKARLEGEAIAQAEAAMMEIVTGQLAINAQEAKHSSVFVAGWRPGVGWVGVAGLAWNFILRDMVMFLGAIFGWPLEDVPRLEADALFFLLSGILGMGGMRSFEKTKGVSRSSITAAAPLPGSRS